MPHSKISMLIALANNPDANPADLLIAANDPKTTPEILLAVAKHPNASIEVWEIIAKHHSATAEVLTEIAARVKLDDDIPESLRDTFASPGRLFLNSMLRSMLLQPDYFFTNSLLYAIMHVKNIASILLAIIDNPNANATTLIALLNNNFISAEEQRVIFDLILNNPKISTKTLVAIALHPSTSHLIDPETFVINLLKTTLNKHDATNEELIKQLTEFVMALIDNRYLNKQNLLSILTKCPEEKKYMLLIAIINAADKFKNPADLAIILTYVARNINNELQVEAVVPAILAAFKHNNYQNSGIVFATLLKNPAIKESVLKDLLSSLPEHALIDIQNQLLPRDTGITPRIPTKPSDHIETHLTANQKHREQIENEQNANPLKLIGDALKKIHPGTPKRQHK